MMKSLLASSEIPLNVSYVVDVLKDVKKPKASLSSVLKIVVSILSLLLYKIEASPTFHVCNVDNALTSVQLVP
jgi:hypothetical protein